MAHTPADLQMNRRRLQDRYEMVVRRGSGGMAEVWEGVDHNLGRKIAIKVLHAHFAQNPSILNRFRSEAQAAARLTHPGIVAIYDTVTTDDTDAIIMELVEGRDLRTSLDERPTLALTDAAEVGIQLAAALGHAHQHGIIHRDVKPANILVRPDRRVKLSDFGIAKALDETGHTESGSLVGTVKYLAPEQLEGRTADARTDLYALTTVLYEMLCGQVPFAAGDLVTAMQRVQVDPPSARAIRPDLPPALDAFLKRGLARNPDDRFVDAQSWTEGLTKSISNDATVIDQPRPTPVPQSIPIKQPESRQEAGLPAPLPTPTTTPPVITAPKATAPSIEPSRPTGPKTARRSPAKADPSVAKHHRRNRGRFAFLGPLMALLLMVAAVATVWLLLSGTSNPVASTNGGDTQVPAQETVETDDQSDTAGTTANEPSTDSRVDATAGTETTSTVVESTTTSIPDFIGGQRAFAFDPFGGDGEHDDIAIRAVDGNPATFWNTQSYRTREFSGLKEGVGLIVEFEDPPALNALLVTTNRTGWSARVYQGDATATDLDGWGAPIGEFTNLDPNSELAIAGATTQAVLLWITDLGVDPEQSQQDYDAQVAEGGFDQRLVVNEIVVVN